MRYPPRVIDAHSHIFNAHYLPIEGMLRTGLGVKEPPSGRGDRFKVWLAQKVKALTIRLVDVVPAGKRIMEDLGSGSGHEALLGDIYGRVLLAAERNLAVTAKAVEFDAEIIRTQLVERLATDPFLRSLTEIQMVFERSGESPDEPSEETEIEIPTEEEVSARARRNATKMTVLASRDLPIVATLVSDAAIEWVLEKVARLLVRWLLGEDFVAFFDRMIGIEDQNAEHILRSYSAEQNVDCMIHLILDMELAFAAVPDDPFWPIETQFRRMRRVSEQRPGQIIGFAGFDPRRKEWRSVCKRALELGFTGFKFYPPMGYRPIGNSDSTIESRCLDFFEFCVQGDIPVFTHCTPTGVQAYDGAGLNGDPRYWADLLKDPAFEKLRLCLGHAGGGRQESMDTTFPGWYAESDAEWDCDNNWAKKVVDLCAQHPNVYCEVGNLHEIVGAGPTGSFFARNFSREWARDTEPHRFSDKCMYGSDSHMAHIANSTTEFLNVFHGIFATTFSPEEFERFCSGNVSEYLKL